MKRIVMFLAISIVLLSISFAVIAQTNDIDLPVPTTGIKLKIINWTYNTKVLNIATDGNPSSGNNVTLWSWSNNQTQWWMNQHAGDDSHDCACYRIAVYGFTYGHLGLNYNQATTKCTIYPFDSNNPYDFRILWYTGVHGYLIQLDERNRLLGASGGTSGSKCYWYSANSPYVNDWNVYAVA